MPTKPNDNNIVWYGKPWMTPALVLRSVAVIAVFAITFFVEFYLGLISNSLLILPVWLLTAALFGVVWLVAILNPVILRASHTYTLRQDGLEVKRGILRQQTFIVTPQGFGDLLVNQSLIGRILDYGDLFVDSQGEKKTRLLLIRNPNGVADKMRDVMGKPIVRVEQIIQANTKN
jgi:uncharacterized membrane protein YdbT with pleckstrin-like domain